MNMRLLAVALLAGAFSLSANSAQGVAKMASFNVWAADPLVKILPETPAPKGAETPIIVEACRNEYESAQVVVTASEDLDDLTVKFSALSGPSKFVPMVEAHFLGFVPVRKGTINTPDEHLVAKPPADIPDPLMDARSVPVKAGTNQPVWLTVHVSRNTDPGTYTGEVEISASGESLTVPLKVTVHDVTVPDERTLYLTNWFWPGSIAKAHGLDLWSEPFWKMLGAYARCMADYRQNVVLTPILSLVTAKEDGAGKLTFDFSRFDRWVKLFQDAGVIGYIEGGHLGGRSEWEAKDFNAHRMAVTKPDGSVEQIPETTTVTTEEYREFLSQFLPTLQNHLKEKGWHDIYMQHLADEPIPANAESYKKLSSYVRELAPGMKIIDASMCTEIAGSLDIWVPQPPEYEHKVAFFSDRRKAGDEVWFYTCLAPKGKYMNRFIDYPLIDTRLLHWMNFKYGLTGYLHWGFNHWPPGDSFTPIESGHPTEGYLPPGDSHIVYPGKYGPLGSVRLEALRDGVEDLELLKLLEKKDPKKARSLCDSVVRTMTDYTLDPAEFRTARAKLIKALE